MASTTGRSEPHEVTVMCPDCNGPRQPLQYLLVLPDGRVMTQAPGARTGTHNARGHQVDRTGEGIPLDRYTPNQPSEEVGRKGAIEFNCQRCGFTRQVGRASIEDKARKAAASGLDRITVTARGELLLEAGLGQAHRRRYPRPE
jgi:hypothetical protein